MSKVAKSFHTANRRFSAGDEVGPNDIQGAVSFETWVERGFIDGPKAKPLVGGDEKPTKNERAGH